MEVETIYRTNSGTAQSLDKNSAPLAGKQESPSTVRTSTFCLQLFDEFQSRMSSYVLCQKHPLRAGPLPTNPEPTVEVLSSQDAVFLGPNALMTFLLIYELQQINSAPTLTASTICQLLNRHTSSGAQAIKRLLRMASKQGFLLQEKLDTDARSVVYRCSSSLSSVLEHCLQQHRQPNSSQPAAQDSAAVKIADDLQALNVQIKRAYLAHKNGQVEYVLEATAMALKALRSRDGAYRQQVVDQKVLLLTLRARALLQCDQVNASDACMHAAIKCLAINASRHPLL